MLLHVGQMVERVFRGLERERPKCTVTWFAGQLNCDRRNVYDIFKRSTIDTQLLVQISLALDHNFYDDIARGIEEELKKRQDFNLTQFVSGNLDKIYFQSEDGKEIQCFGYDEVLMLSNQVELALTDKALRESFGV
ncbi:hypothetical protein [uncultured Bacteroides sp.]|uniref:hypothetical protein n=1 Tax=uncultured Bacteroides sp. TaxID=162156 RepID=UPI00321FC31C